MTMPIQRRVTAQSYCGHSRASLHQCPLWPQMAHKVSAFARLDGRLWLLQAKLDAICAAAALHAIKDGLEATVLLPSAVCV